LLGGGACRDDLIKKALELGLPLVRSYGMTETASQIAATEPGASLEKLLTSGRALEGNAIRIEPSTGRIVVSSHSRMLGYWQNERLEAHANIQGELLTNDYGHFENGYLIVEGRLDRIFKCGGENIQPE